MRQTTKRIWTSAGTSLQIFVSCVGLQRVEVKVPRPGPLWSLQTLPDVCWTIYGTHSVKYCVKLAKVRDTSTDVLWVNLDTENPTSVDRTDSDYPYITFIFQLSPSFFFCVKVIWCNSIVQFCFWKDTASVGGRRRCNCGRLFAHWRRTCSNPDDAPRRDACSKSPATIAELRRQELFSSKCSEAFNCIRTKPRYYANYGNNIPMTSST